MKCPYCQSSSDRVVDSRETQDGHVVRRRRECLDCLKRFTSYERIEEIPYMVIKKDNRRDPFNREKLLQGLLTACQKRPVSVTDLEQIIDEVEALFSSRKDKEISSEKIGNHVINRLKDLDKVAYVRFASVYKQFQDVDEFMDELSKIISRK